MRRIYISLLLCTSLFAQIPTPEMNRKLTELAKTLTSISFEGQKPVTVEGTVGTLVWPEGAKGVLVVKTAKGDQYAFSTARVPDMAKQGFTRFAVKPGTTLKIMGVLAPGNGRIGSDWIAARADTVDQTDGKRLFDRAKLPDGSK